jgi:hypothetical protein
VTVATLIGLLQGADPDSIVVIPHEWWVSVERVVPARLVEIAGWEGRGFIDDPPGDVPCVKLTF